MTATVQTWKHTSKTRKKENNENKTIKQKKNKIIQLLNVMAEVVTLDTLCYRFLALTFTSVKSWINLGYMWDCLVKPPCVASQKIRTAGL